MDLIERLYEAAGNAGLLHECHWQPADGSPMQTGLVGFAAPDDTLFEGLTSTTDYTVSFPASAFVGIAARDTVVISESTFQVREVRTVGDGSELRARLTRL